MTPPSNVRPLTRCTLLALLLVAMVGRADAQAQFDALRWSALLPEDSTGTFRFPAALIAERTTALPEVAICASGNSR